MAAVARYLLSHQRKIGNISIVVPAGSIAIWTGLLANIPAGWQLCDGTLGTPNLVARFIRGAPAATEPGTTGGSDTHTHASMTASGGHTHTAQNLTHQHTVNAAGAHNHHPPQTSSIVGTGYTYIALTAGSHQHTTSTATHSHTMDTTADHTHPISTDDGRPPYYEVAFIQAHGVTIFPANIIIIWTGLLVNIPAGWNLCDGGGGRPDLRSRFIRGVNTAVTNPGAVGGAATHIHTETAQAAHTHDMDDCATHSHSFSAFTWTHNHNGSTSSLAAYTQTDTHAGDHTHANSDSTGTHNHNPMGDDGAHAHVVNATSSLPAYYDVAYIINDGGATEIPSGGILIWTGLLADIPVGYSQHAGLQSRFSRGSDAGVDPGGVAGNDTHTHTDQDAGAHSGHTQTTAGAHQHSPTDSIGAHTHATGPSGGGSTGGSINLLALDGAHSHTYNSEDDHNNHVLTDPGNHNHNNWSTDDGRPAFYEVAFIQKT